MTNSLIPVFNGSISNVSIQLCNARELHSFLEIGRDYSNWINNRITDYGFVQDEDYIIVTERTNGRPRKEYHITLDMGKELAMVERNEKGRQIRKYFIECERQVLQNNQQIAPLAKHKGIAHLTNEQITVDLNHYQTLVHLARTASSATAHLFEQQTNVLKACGFAFSPLNSQAHQAELVREMQFVIDDAEANFRRHIRRNTF